MTRKSNKTDTDCIRRIVDMAFHAGERSKNFDELVKNDNAKGRDWYLKNAHMRARLMFRPFRNPNVKEGS